MTQSQLTSRGIQIHRKILEDNIKGLLTAHQLQARNYEPDTFAAGYSAGFQDALFTVAQMAGVSVNTEQGLLTPPRK